MPDVVLLLPKRYSQLMDPLIAPRTARTSVPLPVLFLVLSLILFGAGGLATAEPELRTETVSGEEIPVTVRPGAGDHVLLWIAPEYGFRAGHAALAERLAAEGLEIWQADVAEALFLPRGSGGMRELTGEYVAELVKRAHAATGKRIVLVSDAYGAIPVLRGARLWQADASQAPDATPYLVGAVLFSPSAQVSVPPLGVDPEYLPIVHASTLPVLILQTARNGNRWQLPGLVEALQRGGATVYQEVLPEVTALFFGNPPPPEAQRQFARLSTRLPRLIALLERTPTPLQAAALPEPPSVPAGSGLDAAMQPYRGDPQPHPLSLPDAAGKPYRLAPEDYRGRITLVNFWASWCPPCVEEIPSLNRLQAQLQDLPFELVSVNYAEDTGTVRAFMEKVQVDFPVLMDADGSETARWKVVTFPSTFVVGPDGQIHYGVNAAIDWDAPEVVAALRELLARRD